MTRSKDKSPVSESVIEICEILEDIGESPCATIAKEHGEWTTEQASKYCHRGTELGVLELIGNGHHGKKYKAAPGWRQIVADRAPIYTLPEPPPTKWRGISSPFQMAEKWGLSV